MLKTALRERLLLTDLLGAAEERRELLRETNPLILLALESTVTLSRQKSEVMERGAGPAGRRPATDA